MPQSAGLSVPRDALLLVLGGSGGRELGEGAVSLRGQGGAEVEGLGIQVLPVWGYGGGCVFVCGKGEGLGATLYSSVYGVFVCLA